MQNWKNARRSAYFLSKIHLTRTSVSPLFIFLASHSDKISRQGQRGSRCRIYPALHAPPPGALQNEDDISAGENHRSPSRPHRQVQDNSEAYGHAFGRQSKQSSLCTGSRNILQLYIINAAEARKACDKFFPFLSEWPSEWKRIPCRSGQIKLGQS